MHFVSDPDAIEAALPGLLAYGSARGSSIGRAGLCDALDRLTDPVPASSCPRFERRAQ